MKKAIVSKSFDKLSYKEAVSAYGCMVVKYSKPVNVGDDLGDWHDTNLKPQLIECPDGGLYLVEAI